jgi:hypothetical protein
MPLVVDNAFVTQDILIQQLLELEKGGRFMPADIPEVIWAAAPDGKGPRVLILLDMDFVECGVVVILHPECHGAQQLIMFNEFHVADGMDFFAPADDFVCAVVVNKFQ